jgi:hypothetical protein
MAAARVCAVSTLSGVCVVYFGEAMDLVLQGNALTDQLLACDDHCATAVSWRLRKVTEGDSPNATR